jgi:hypothetical protein
MPARTPARLVRDAAASRAAGNAWEKVAADVGRTTAVVRTWPRRYADVWRKAFADAERRALAEATAEAVVLLRKQLRSEDEKSVREASLKLVQIRLMLEKADRPDKKPPADSPPGYADRLLALVRGMTDEQIAAELAAASVG